MPEDKELNELDEQVSDETEEVSEQVDEDEQDAAIADTDTSDSESDSEVDKPEAENLEPAPAPAPTPVARPLNIPMPVAPVLGRTGEALWGPGEQQLEKPKPKSELSDLFAIPQPGDNDIFVDDLFEIEDQSVDMEEDLSDLTSVSMTDIMGEAPKPKQTTRYKRTSRRYEPPTTLGGIG